MWYLIIALVNGLTMVAPMQDQDTCEATLTAVVAQLVKAKVKVNQARCGYRVEDTPFPL
jgi:hypothetical protein